MPKVLIADKLSPAALEIFAHRSVQADVKVGLSKEQLLEIIGDYDGLAIRSATKVTAEVLKAAPKLKVVGRAGIGVDNVDVEAATAAGVVVMNTPFGNATTTAEHAIAMMMALARDIPAADRSTRVGRWEKSRFMGAELTGKTLGVVGCGNIGSIVADRARGLRMKVAGFDPFLSDARAEELGIEKMELDELCRRADVITMHTPLTEQTRNLFSRERLLSCKKGVRIVNCARGGLIDEQALHDLIVDGHIAGAALDVFAVEPARDNPLFALEQVVVTPHLGASTTEAQENVALQVAEQIADYLLDGAIINALNMPSVSAEDAPRLRPYMMLAEQLGSFAGQLTETGLKGATVTFAGQAASLNTKPLTQLILKGLLAPFAASVNMVNAPALAKSRGIQLTTVTHEHVDGYQTLITLEVVTEKGPRTVSGTLFQGVKPRLVEIRGIPIDAELSDSVLYVRNHDRPGFIGALGQLLGDANVNIATFHLGRDRPGGDAIALISIDQPMSAVMLEKIRTVPHVIQVKQLRF